MGFSLLFICFFLRKLAFISSLAGSPLCGLGGPREPTQGPHGGGRAPLPCWSHRDLATLWGPPAARGLELLLSVSGKPGSVCGGWRLDAQRRPSSEGRCRGWVLGPLIVPPPPPEPRPRAGGCRGAARPSGAGPRSVPGLLPALCSHPDVVAHTGGPCGGDAN